MDIALALGGGGVKGNAHVGVLRVLDREGYKVRAIAGTSAGGLWGCFYAAGYTPAEIEARVRQIDSNELYQRNPGDLPAFLGLTGVSRWLENTIGELTFADLNLPFAVTAVDIDTAKPLTIDSGRVADAVLATIAVPGIFPPKKLDGRMLIDGGIVNPVPVALARTLAPGLPVVAVVLSPILKEWEGPDKPRLFTNLPFFADYIAKLRIAQALNIFLRSIDIGGVMMTELRLEIDKPEVIIRPKVAQIGLLDDVDPVEIIRIGEVAANGALPDLRRAVSWRGRLASKFSYWYSKRSAGVS